MTSLILPNWHMGVSRSGGEVKLFRDDNGKIFVRKFKPLSTPSSRFHKHIERQQSFSDDHSAGAFQTPKVVFVSDDLDFFDMEFVPYPTLAQSLVNMSPSMVRRITNDLMYHVESSFSGEYQPAKKIVLSAKIEQIKSKVGKFGYYKARANALLDKTLEFIPETMNVPIGRSHGDLTFSNIMFDQKKFRYWLVDFIDSPIETPLQDYAKFFQELNMMWSWRNSTYPELARLRIGIILREMRKIVLNNIDEAHLKNIDVITLMTKIRILPYARNLEEFNFVLETTEDFLRVRELRGCDV